MIVNTLKTRIKVKNSNKKNLLRIKYIQLVKRNQITK